MSNTVTPADIVPEFTIVPTFTTVTGGSVYSGLSTKSIRRFISAGKLQAYRPARGRVLISIAELDALIRNSTQRLRRGRGIYDRSTAGPCGGDHSETARKEGTIDDKGSNTTDQASVGRDHED